MEGKRTYFWDNLKGVLIFLVVLGHFLYDFGDIGLSRYIVGTIYMFHMPAFIFISGYFSKRDSVRTKYSTVKLVIAYFIFNFILMLLNMFTLGFNSASLLYPYNSMWYIPAIIVWRYAVKPLSKIQGVMPLSIIAAFLIGYWGEFDNKLAICRIVVFFPFFLAGYNLKASAVDKLIKKQKASQYILGGFITAAALVYSVILLYTYKIPAGAFLMEAYNASAEIIYRLMILALAALFIIGLLRIAPNRKIPFVSTLGKNSLVVYLYHRPFTLIFSQIFKAENYTEMYVVYGILGALLITLIFGCNRVANAVNGMLERLTAMLTTVQTDKKRQKIRMHIKDGVIYLLILIMLIQPVAAVIYEYSGMLQDDIILQTYGEMYDKISDAEQKMLDNSLKLAFVGDLILLKDQVAAGYDANSGTYNFDSVFKYAKSYLQSADLAVGIFEGPIAGDDKGYSTSNFDDGLPLYLNYPDAFAQAVKNSGIDLVSTANNHLLDMGEQGVKRTLDILDGINLDHLGSYRSKQEKQQIKSVKIGKLTCAVLAYTYGSNYYTSDYFINENPDLTSLICAEDEPYFDCCRESVYKDFERAKELNPDLIIVIPHMGTQFLHTADDFQNTWNDIFIDAGADIILGDHSHAVQPIEYRTNGEKTAVIVNSPGNFANSYCDYNGDATAIVNIYLDADTAAVNAVSVVPMYTYSEKAGEYCALPIYKAVYDEEINTEISGYEMQRIEEVHSLITSVMLEKNIPLDNVEPEYIIFKDGYKRGKPASLKTENINKNSILYKALSENGSVCFVGDSVTEGTANGGYGWYEPLVGLFPQLTVYNCSKGGATTTTMLERADEFSAYKADVYVIALGTNDVRYSESTDIAEKNLPLFINNVDSMVKAIRQKRSDAQIIFISPWCALNNDSVITFTPEERDVLLEKYSEALSAFCKNNSCEYLNISAAIYKTISRAVSNYYMKDHIHPNVVHGIVLYSELALQE